MSLPLKEQGKHSHTHIQVTGPQVGRFPPADYLLNVTLVLSGSYLWGFFWGGRGGQGGERGVGYFPRPGQGKRGSVRDGDTHCEGTRAGGAERSPFPVVNYGAPGGQRSPSTRLHRTLCPSACFSFFFLEKLRVWERRGKDLSADSLILNPVRCLGDGAAQPL